MTEPSRESFKNKVVTIVTDRDDEEQNPSRPQSNHQLTPQRQSSITIRNAENENGSASNGRRQSRMRRSRKSVDNVELITLQETATKSQPPTLKASFLRRKAKEYEGKIMNDRILSAIHSLKVDFVIVDTSNACFYCFTHDSL